MIMAFTLKKISQGKVMEIRETSHLPSCVTFLTIRQYSSRLRGPEMRDLKGPSVSHLSCQKLRLLFDPTFHLQPCVKTSFPFFIPNQVREQFLLGLRYLQLNTLAQR
ncbi:hypothetical protein ACJW30_12G126600 [Castanea mollissima]